MAIYTFNARMPASEVAIEDLLMQAKKIRYDVIGLTETRGHQLLNATSGTGEELFLGTSAAEALMELVSSSTPDWP